LKEAREAIFTMWKIIEIDRKQTERSVKSKLKNNEKRQMWYQNRLKEVRKVIERLKRSNRVMFKKQLKDVQKAT
jgi:hypothetical protein